MKLFDLHSDTLYESYRRKLSPITSKELQAPLGISPFAQTKRVSAIWCDNVLDDESAWQAYLDIFDYTQNQLIQTPLPDGTSLLYAVEDARLLAGRLERLETLAQNGTRILTLTWQGLSVIGGAWDTDEGLTDFGKEVVKAAQSLGIVIDISHASDKAAREALALSEHYGSTVIASHSNARAICPHRRNLTDYLFDALAERSAPVGISMVSYHLGENENATVDTLLSHIAHLLTRKNGAKALALGSDFDGTDALPQGIRRLSDLPLLYHSLENAFGKTLADRIFFENAEDFFTENNR